MKDHHCLPDKVKCLTVSIPLDKILLKRSCDAVIDLTIDSVSPSVNVVMSQLPPDCVVSQPSSDCIMSRPPSDSIVLQPSSDCVMPQSSSTHECIVSQPPSDCMMSQPSSDCIVSQPPSDCVMSQPPSDCVVLQPPSDCVVSQPLSDCVVSQLPSDCVMSQPPSDCVTLKPHTDDDTFHSHSTNEDMKQASHDEVLATRLRFSSEGDHIKRCTRKRKRKCVSVPEFPQQQQVEQQCNSLAVMEEERAVVCGVIRNDQLPVVTVMLHHRGLWTAAIMVSIASVLTSLLTKKEISNY